LYTNGIEKIKSDQYELDDLLDSPLDKRRGISLVIKPNEQVAQRIQHFLDILKHIEPGQYYYPTTDLHITVMALISCYDGFDMDQIKVEDYIDLIQKILPKQTKIEINFQGITASSGCVMIQGFPQQTVLHDIRNSLRTAFKTSTLQQSLDHRYPLRTAHITAARFRTPFTAKEEFLQTLENFRNYDFGISTINEIEFVYNDWYLKEQFTKTLFRFSI